MTAGSKPFEDALYTEMLSHIKQTDLSVPVRRGEYLYYSRTEEGKQYPILCRKKGSLEAKEEVLIDLNELGQGKKFVGLGALAVSHSVVKAIGIVARRLRTLGGAGLVAVVGRGSREDTHRAQAVCLRTMVAKPDSEPHISPSIRKGLRTGCPMAIESPL